MKSMSPAVHRPSHGGGDALISAENFEAASGAARVVDLAVQRVARAVDRRLAVPLDLAASAATHLKGGPDDP